MTIRSATALGQRLFIPAMALAMALGAQTAAAQRGSRGPVVRATAPVIEAGNTTPVIGRGFESGQPITLSTDGMQLNADPFVANDSGRFRGQIMVPATADLGPLPVTIRSDDSTIGHFTIKISKQVPLFGASRFALASNQLVPGLYQAAYSARSGAVYVTSAVGRPPISESTLLKVDPNTLEVLARTTPPVVSSSDDGGPAGVYAVYGVAVDDSHGTVWVTNTRQGTAAVYRQDDLSLVKQFPVGTAPHARAVVIAGQDGKAYVSALGAGSIAVYDTDSLELLTHIELATASGNGGFVPAGLALNRSAGKLYAVDLGTPEVAVIDTASGEVERLIPLPGARSAIGVAWDAADQRILVAAQGSDNLLVIDPRTGRVVHDVYVGAGALSVAWEPVSGLAFVSTRAAGTIAVVDPASGELVANLSGGSFPNHVTVDGNGRVFAINKSRGADDPLGNRITRISQAVQ